MYTTAFIEDILSSNSQQSKEALISITKYLMTYHLDVSNCGLFQRILHKNIKEAADIIFRRRTPETFFSTLQPNRELITNAINTLVSYKTKELYPKIILTCLGVLENAYKQSKPGFKIYPLKTSDLQHIGKYLTLNDETISKMIIDILHDIWQSRDNKDKEVAVIAEKIIDIYQDNKKNLINIIPENLLI